MMIDMVYLILAIIGDLPISQTSPVEIPQFEFGQDTTCQTNIGHYCILFNAPSSQLVSLKFSSSYANVLINFTTTFNKVPLIVLSNSVDCGDSGLSGFQIEAQSITTSQFTLIYRGLSSVLINILNVHWLAINDPTICVHYACLSPTASINSFTYNFNMTYPWFESPNGATFISGYHKLSFTSSLKYNMKAELNSITINHFTINLLQDGSVSYSICLHSVFGPKEYLLSYPQSINYWTDPIIVLGTNYESVELLPLTVPQTQNAYVAGLTYYSYPIDLNPRIFLDYDTMSGYFVWQYYAPCGNFSSLNFGIMRIQYIPFSCDLNFRFKIVNSNQCQCIDGYLINIFAYPYECDQCNPDCKTCNTNVDFCTACSFANAVLGSDGTCSCISQYILTSPQVCTKCSSPCLTCNRTITSCLTCVDSYYFESSNDPIILDSNQCKLCDESCLKCTQIQCLQCKDQFKMIIQSTKCICIDGYYYNNGQCSLCGYHCAQCNITSNYCIQCVNQLMTPINGLCSCIQGYYQTMDNKCLKCNPQCSTCYIQSNNCTSCLFLNSILNNSNCLCKDGYFRIADQQCVICSGNCALCQSKDQCVKCSQGYYLSNNSCIICPLGCSSCILTESQIHCGTCQQGYELVDNSCQTSQSQGIAISSQNNSIRSQTINQIFISGTQIDLSINFVNMYINNDLIVNIAYQTKEFVSSICQISVDDFNLQEFSFQTNTSNQAQGQIHTIFFSFSKTITKSDSIYIYICFQSDSQHQAQQYGFIKTPIQLEFFSQEQKSKVANVQTGYSSLQISLIISAILTALFGGFMFILAICDVITWLSTFYYLNINYPYNVNFIFQNINLQQFIFIPSFESDFNQKGDPYYFTSPYRFMKNQVDPLFLNNIPNDCLLIISPILFYVLSIVYFKIEIKFKIQAYILDKQNNGYLIIVFKFIRIKAHYFIRYFKAITLKQIHLNMLDLVMACSLQLMSNSPNQYLIVLINSLMSVITLMVLFYLCYRIYLSARQHQLIHKSKVFNEQYQCIYENIQLSQFDQRFYGCIILYSKILYILFLVFLYDYPIIQTAACASQYFILIAYLFYVNPYPSLNKFCLDVIPNFCVLAILLITVFLAVNEQIHIVQDLEKIGWVIIAFICISMLTQFYFVLQEVITSIYGKFKKIN